jgi:hypothetical protein
MELIKLNENFQLKDKFQNGWLVIGTVGYSVDGDVYISASIDNEFEIPIGRLTYHKPVQGDIILEYDVSEELISEFTTYVDTLIDSILKYFNN